MKRFFLAFLFFATPLYAQQQMAENVTVTSLNANATAAPQTGTAFSIGGQLNTITWIVTFASAPASQTTVLETSNDNSAWATADTTTNVNGDSRTIFTAARFVRVTESARSGGGAITATLVAKRSPVSNTSLSTASNLDVNSITVEASSVPTIRLGKNNVYMQGLNAAGNGWINMFGISTSNLINVGAVLDSNGINVGGVASAGAITGGGTNSIGGFQAMQTAASGYFGWSGRAQMLSSADGLINLTKNSQTVTGIQINTGTAAPTVTTCSTGTIDSHSTNTSGKVTATGATACTVTFGAPNWSQVPFCIATNGTGARALWISSPSVSAFTVNGLTAGDIFFYHCFGSAF